jgi:hypothetical protein
MAATYFVKTMHVRKLKKYATENVLIWCMGYTLDESSFWIAPDLKPDHKA